jgi:hypothetical protein
MAIAASACSVPRLVPRPQAIAAVVGPDSAYFVFPSATRAELTWNTPDADNTRGAPYRMWTVAWEPFPIGTDSVSFIAIERQNRPTASADHGSLEELLAETAGYEGFRCWACKGVASTFRSKPYITAYARDNHVVIVVRGSDAVRHLFWARPPRVALGWSDADYREVAVQYR